MVTYGKWCRSTSEILNRRNISEEDPNDDDVGRRMLALNRWVLLWSRKQIETRNVKRESELDVEKLRAWQLVKILRRKKRTTVHREGRTLEFWTSMFVVHVKNRLRYVNWTSEQQCQHDLMLLSSSLRHVTILLDQPMFQTIIQKNHYFFCEILYEFWSCYKFWLMYNNGGRQKRKWESFFFDSLLLFTHLENVVKLLCSKHRHCLMIFLFVLGFQWTRNRNKKNKEKWRRRSRRRTEKVLFQIFLLFYFQYFAVGEEREREKDKSKRDGFQ